MKQDDKDGKEQKAVWSASAAVCCEVSEEESDIFKFKFTRRLEVASLVLSGNKGADQLTTAMTNSCMLSRCSCYVSQKIKYQQSLKKKNINITSQNLPLQVHTGQQQSPQWHSRSRSEPVQRGSAL